MNRRITLVALAIVPLAGLFLWAREAASWRPKAISETEFYARLAPSAGEIDFTEETIYLPTKRQQLLQKRAQNKGWRLRAISSDGNRLLTQGASGCGGAILEAQKARVFTKLAIPQNTLCGRWFQPGWTGDAQIVWFATDAGPIQFFDARTGRHLWDFHAPDEIVIPSPNGRFVLFHDTNGVRWSVYEARTGREVESMNVKWGQIGFSRDSRFVLLEATLGQFRTFELP